METIYIKKEEIDLEGLLLRNEGIVKYNPTTRKKELAENEFTVPAGHCYRKSDIPDLPLFLKLQGKIDIEGVPTGHSGSDDLGVGLCYAEKKYSWGDYKVLIV